MHDTTLEMIFLTGFWPKESSLDNCNGGVEW